MVIGKLDLEEFFVKSSVRGWELKFSFWNFLFFITTSVITHELQNIIETLNFGTYLKLLSQNQEFKTFFSAHVTSLCSNPNGSYQLISASLDGTVRIWSVDDGMLLNTIKITDKNSFGVACAVPLYGLKATKKGIHLLSGNDYGRCSFPEQAEAETSLEVVQKDVINFNLPRFVFKTTSLSAVFFNSYQ